ncbi:IlvGEDA operon leader peptide, partial [Proteus terrae]
IINPPCGAALGRRKAN